MNPTVVEGLRVEIQNFLELNWQSTEEIIAWDAYKAYIRGILIQYKARIQKTQQLEKKND